MTASRRRFLQTTSTAAFALALPPYRATAARPRFSTTPFTLGVASGDPTEEAVVLWTRLAPAPGEPDGGMPPDPVRVRWEVAEDEGFARVRRRGEVVALPELGHSVHVDVRGLGSARVYWYRFMTGDELSPVGRTRTLPPRRGAVDSLRFAACSCQHYEPGYFVAYRTMVEDEPDFVLHLGDYIYDVSFGDTFRKHESPSKPETLAEFRARYACYKLDPDLQEAHRQLPFVAVPDNHDALEFDDPGAWSRRAAAYQAWYEHLPIRATYRAGSASLPIYRSLDLGDLARLSILDTRQFRDDQEVCRDGIDPDFGFGIYRRRCPGLEGESRTMLGREQESWLDERLSSTVASWNVVATTVPMVPFEFHRNGDRYIYYGSWNAYPANRDRLLRRIDEGRVRNPVFVSADVHSSWVSDIPRGEAVVATEFTSTSISSGWPPPLADPVTENLDRNPQVRAYEPTRRGYALHELRRSSWTTRMRTMSSITRRDPEVVELGPFVIEDGRPGAVR